MITMATIESLSPYLPLGHPYSEEDQGLQRSMGRRRLGQRQASGPKAPEGRHMYVVGRTGQGKTTFVKAVIGKKLENFPYYNVYHVDTKKARDVKTGDYEYTEADGRVIVSSMAPPAFTTYGNRMVWRPTEDSKPEYDKFFMGILDAGIPSIVNIDETKNMVFGKLDNIPRGLGLILYQGRAPGINVYGGTQEVYQSP